MKSTVIAGLTALGMAGLVVACAPQPQQPTAQEDFMTLCTDCHGDGGKGDGPLAESLPVKPADVTTIQARNDGVFPKARVMSHIYGFTPGRSESPMPAFGDLLDGETVMYDSGDGIPTPTPARLVALMEYVEAMQE